MNRRAFLVGASALAAVGGLAACTPSSGGTSAPSTTTPASGVWTKHTDLAYAAPVGRAHLLDLYVPTGGTKPFPVVIYTAGSAFMSDDTKSGMPPGGMPSGAVPPGGVPSGAAPAGGGAPTGLGGMTTAQSLADMWGPKGYAVAGVNIRSSSEAKFPAQVFDIKAAIRYLRANAAQYGLDTDRFATMGTSSGAWFATMAATTAGVADLEGDLGNPGQRSDVQAVVDLFGPTDFLQMDAHRLPTGQEHDPASSPESQLMGFALQTNPAEVERANPAAYVRASSPPAYISHGTADPLVPYYESQLLFAAYQKAGATASLTIVPNAVHTDSYLASANDSPGRTVSQTTHGQVTTGTEPAPTYDTLLQFLDTHLRR